MYNKKTYNTSPARYDLNISPSKRSYLSKDKTICQDKGLDALDFVLWYDTSLLDADVSFSQPPFDFLLQCIEKGLIRNNKIGNAFRLACLIFSAFAACDTSKVEAMRKSFLADNSDFFEKTKLAAYRSVDFNAIYVYDRVTANKMMFPFFKSKGINKNLIAELISRRLIAFDDKHTYKNIIYVCQDVYGNNKGIEKSGMTAKYFMQLQGTAFPFVYYREETEQIKPRDFERIEAYGSTLDMLKALSALYETDEGIPFRTLYISLHKSNYSTDAYNNFRSQFDDIETVWHCDKQTEYTPVPQKEVSEVIEPPIVIDVSTVEEVPATKHKPEKETPRKYEPDKKFSELGNKPPVEIVLYSEQQLIEMKNNNQLTEEWFAMGNDDYEPEYSFDEIIKMKQRLYYENKICFVNENNDEYDIFGRTMLPF